MNPKPKEAIDQGKLTDLLRLGIDTKLANKIISAGYSSNIISAPERELSKHFESWEVSEIEKATKRKPLPKAITTRLLQESDFRCCICWDISKESPVIIHHIIEHSKTLDDSYDNLVVICLNHHALAHSKWEISRHPLPPERLKQTKLEWIQAISDFKRGLRSAPGKFETSTQFTQSDKETLRHLAAFIDRPAMHQSFNVEGNMHDFLQAVTGIIQALNTGILKTREGDEIIRTKPSRMLANPNWREKLGIICSLFEELRTRFEIAVRDGELILRPNGFYCFNNRNFPFEIDAMRRSIALLFNEILKEAEVGPIRKFPDLWLADRDLLG